MWTAAIITASDSGARGERKDVSGQIIAQLLIAAGYVIHSRVVLPDEREQLSAKMKELTDEHVALIITTGGTGFSPRDCMPEATLAVVERQCPGIPEAMRVYSLQLTRRAMLSRGVAGIRKQSLIVNLPGSPKAVEECLGFVLPTLEHGINILRGEGSECAR